MSRAAALAAQALALIAAGLVLIVAAITAPEPPAPEPLRYELRPATAQERRDYERQRLADSLDELRQQREGATALHKP